MYTKAAVASALTLAAGIIRAEEAVYVGENAADVSLETWESVADQSNATSTAKFPGVDITKAYPGEAKDGWELTIAVKNNITGPGDDADSLFTGTTMSIAYPEGGNNATVDDSWHFCLYSFMVKPSSAKSDGFVAGSTPSCKDLVGSECIDDLKKNAVKNYAKDSCPVYKTTPSCLRDLEEVQEGMALSVSAANASDYFIEGVPFFRKVDGTYATDADNAEIFDTANNQPMAVVAVFGASGDSDQDPIAEVACVMPGAQEAESAASALSASFVGLAAAGFAAALALAL